MKVTFEGWTCMHFPSGPRFWRLLVIVTIPVMMLGAASDVMAEQIGTTPEGNVIYDFRCPAIVRPVFDLDVKWEKHLGSHPTWKTDGGPGMPEPFVTTQLSKVRNGQELSCNYAVHFNGQSKGRITYRYKVHREIISCETTSEGWKCILKEGGGGQSSSSATAASSPQPAKCIGLGCESQPNPGRCIGMGCESKTSGPQRGASGLEEP